MIFPLLNVFILLICGAGFFDACYGWSDFLAHLTPQIRRVVFGIGFMGFLALSIARYT